MSHVTTKVGDNGTTRLISGDIVSKDNIIVECTGQLDNARAQIALIQTMIETKSVGNNFKYSNEIFTLKCIIHMLFLIGTEINDPYNKHPEYRVRLLDDTHLDFLERKQAAIEKELVLPKSFIYKGSTLLSCHIDVAATHVRNLERCLVKLKNEIPEFECKYIMKFINRLSDYLYVLSRWFEDNIYNSVNYNILDKI